MDLLTSLEEKLAPHGIRLRGVVSFEDGEGPPAASGFARTVILLGNAGGSIWTAFSEWRKNQPDQGGPNPMDDWSRFVIQPVAEEFHAAAYYPSDKPWWPFQQWAVRAEGLRASPMGLLIHPEFGLWHGYRGALGFAQPLVQAKPPAYVLPCESCDDKPCLSTCPVEAIHPDRFDVVACRTFLRSPEGQISCVAEGCTARNACPVGREHRYPPEQLLFHMRALGV